MNDPAVWISMGTLAMVVIGGVVQAVTSRATNRKINAEAAVAETKLPAEVDSIIASTADVAVIALGKVIKAQAEQMESERVENERREARRVDERRRDHARMVELEAQVDELRGVVATAERHLAEARAAGERLAGELREARAEQADRK